MAAPTYKELLAEAKDLGLRVVERDLWAYNGLIKNRTIIIRETIPTEMRKAEILAEEIGHFHTTVGNILDQTIPANRIQEKIARHWAYDKMIGLSGLVDACLHNCHSILEKAEFLKVTEEFMREAMDCYTFFFSPYVIVDGYTLHFGPKIWVEREKS